MGGDSVLRRNIEVQGEGLQQCDGGWGQLSPAARNCRPFQEQHRMIGIAKYVHEHAHTPYKQWRI